MGAKGDRDVINEKLLDHDSVDIQYHCSGILP